MYSIVVLIYSTSKRFARPTEGNQMWAGKPYWATWPDDEEVGSI
jgi:hypothetical protein